MLKLLIGRAGSGKTTRILQSICSGARQGVNNQILIVPEQYSHETERLLCKAGGDSISLFAEVLSFTRLSNRVFSVAGGLARTALDNGGRLLTLSLAVNAVRSQLTLFSGSSGKTEFLSSLLTTAQEFVSYCVTPEMLSTLGDKTQGGTSAKLKDLSLIYGAYLALTEQGDADPSDKLIRLAEKLDACGYLSGRNVFIDSFTDFTALELKVVEKLIKLADNVTISLNYDDKVGDTTAFYAGERTLGRLKRIAERLGKSVEIERCEAKEYKPRELVFLESKLFEYDNEIFDSACGAIELCCAKTAVSECEMAASRILELVRDGGYRFRDIAVVSATFDDYSRIIERVFGEYGIPVFLDQKTDILQKPVIALLIAAMDTITGGFEYEDVFRYLKTGLAGLTLEECDRLENYVIKRSIRGSLWTRKEGWGFPKDDAETLAELNCLRERVRLPLLSLQNDARKAETASGQVWAVYNFMDTLGIAERLEEKTVKLLEMGDARQAEDYSRLWEVLCAALEQCASVLGDIPLGLTEFAKLLKLLLTQYDLGSIPLSLDAVSAGDIKRAKHRSMPALFVLGAVDGALPKTVDSGGLITEQERKLLAELGLELAPTSTERLFFDLGDIYSALSGATQRLYMSYPRSSAGGNEQRPSFLIGRLRHLFPELELRHEAGELFRVEGSAFELAAEAAGGSGGRWAAAAYEYYTYQNDTRLAAALQAARLTRGSLSQKAVRGLYGNRLNVSASRVDKYYSCRFAYFMQYGLAAKPRKAASFDAPEFGTFMHFVLEGVTSRLKDEGGFKEAAEERIKELTREYVAKYSIEELGGLKDKTARFIYLFERLEAAVIAIVRNVVRELAASDFQPLAFELEFSEDGQLPPVTIKSAGTEVRLRGAVDRVDGWECGDKLYLRIVDYKTGKKSFDLTDVSNGIGLQMLIYLFALSDEEIFGKRIITAGVLYLPAREVIVSGSRNIDSSLYHKIMSKQLKRSGLMLADPEVLSAMEHFEGSEAEFLPLKRNKDGELASGYLASLDQLSKLGSHVDRLLGEMGTELAMGAINADPYFRGQQNNACLYCEFSSACHFNEDGGDKIRYASALSGDEFWKALEVSSNEL